MRIRYPQGGIPDTFVTSPNLRELACDRTIPHLYSQEKVRLCLYLPSAGQWSPADFLADSIVPWAYTWLFFFEDWLLTDEWKGGGVHPT